MLDTLQNEAADVKHDKKNHYQLVYQTARSYIFWDAGLFFTYNTLPFGWKISPYVYHTTGLLSSSYSSDIGSLCLLYIDDRHNGSCRYHWTKVNTRHRLLSMNVIRQQPDQLFSLLRIVLLNWATSLARRSRS